MRDGDGDGGAERREEEDGWRDQPAYTRAFLSLLSLSHPHPPFPLPPPPVELCDYRPTPASPPTRVAVKRLRPGCSLDVADLAAEARVLASLRHPNIVRFLGVGSTAASPGAAPGADVGPGGRGAAPPRGEDCCYLVQAYVGGGTLKRAVGAVAARPAGAPPPYSLADAAAWGADIAAGLAFLHSSNPVIVHRDLKLENVLLTKGEDGGEGGGGGRGGGAPRPSPPAPPAPARPPSPAPAPPPPARRIALLADFGLATAFDSPDLDTRRSALATAPTAAWWRAGSGRLAGGSTPAAGGGSGVPGPAAAVPAPDLGRPRASAVAAQLARLAAGEAMDDARVSAAAGALDAALSAWGGGGAAGGGAPHPHPPPPAAQPRRRAAVPPPPQHNRHVFALTAKTGSYLYMAPEITLGSPYNQAADMHSLGVLLWEVFAGKTVAAVVLAATPPGADLGSVAELFAHRVARGFRPPIPPAWPETLRSLVSACWAHAPDARPRAAAVAAGLAGLAAGAGRWEVGWAAGLPDGGGGAGEGGGAAPEGGVLGTCCACM